MIGAHVNNTKQIMFIHKVHHDLTPLKPWAYNGVRSTYNIPTQNTTRGISQHHQCIVQLQNTYTINIHMEF